MGIINEGKRVSPSAAGATTIESPTAIRPGEVRNPAQIHVGRRYLWHTRDQVRTVTVLTEPAEWKGSIQVTTGLKGERVELRREEDLGRYVMVEIDQSSLHRHNPLIPPTSKETMFFADVGLDGRGQRQNYLEKEPPASK